MSWGANNIGLVIYNQLAGLVTNRVYPVVMPQNPTYPAICYNIISVTPDHTKNSTSVADKVRVQIDMHDKDIDTLNALASNVRDALDFLSGTIAGVNVNTSRFDSQDIFFEDSVRLYTISQDYIFRLPADAPVDGLTIGAISGEMIQTITAKTSDYTAANIIPSGYAVSLITIENISANTAQLSCGTSAGGSNIFAGVSLPTGITTITVNETLSTTLYNSLYFNHAGSGDTWNSATLNIYILLTKIK